MNCYLGNIKCNCPFLFFSTKPFSRYIQYYLIKLKIILKWFGVSFNIIFQLDLKLKYIRKQIEVYQNFLKNKKM